MASEVVSARAPRAESRRRTTVGTAEPAVVQVVQTLGKGGLEAMAANLAVALHQRGHRSEIVSLEDGGVLEDALATAGVPYHVIGGGRWRSPRTHARLLRLLRAARPTVVHTHHFAALLTAALPTALAGVPHLVHTEHAFQYLEPSRTLRTVLGALSRRTSRFVVVGEEMRRYYEREVGVGRARLQVIRNGIDTDRYRPHADVAAARRRLGLPDGVLVGTAGRFATVKNYPLLIRAAARARAAVPDLRLVMLGDGEDRAALERLAHDVGLDGAVSFLGWRTDAHDLFGALDLFALTSLSEALPLVVLEAMACGLPAVTSAVGDLPRIVRDGETGYTFPSQDEDALTALLVRLAGDASARARLGRRARERVVDAYAQSTMVDEYVKAYAADAP